MQCTTTTIEPGGIFKENVLFFIEIMHALLLID